MTVVIILACLFTLLLARVPVAFALGFLGLAMLVVGCLLYTSDAADE